MDMERERRSGGAGGSMEVPYVLRHVCGNVRLVLHHEIFRPPSAIMHVLCMCVRS